MADDPWNEDNDYDDDYDENEGPAEVLFQAKVMFAFEATCDVELNINVGDVVNVTRADVGGGWYEGELNGVTGLFPEAYVDKIEGSETSAGTAAAAAAPTPVARAAVSYDQGEDNYENDQDALKNANGRNLVMEGTRWAFAHDINPITVKASQSKGSKFGGVKQFTLYAITDSATGLTVERRFKHFLWLHEQLHEMYPTCSIPPIPEKQVTGRFEENFIDQRRRLLQRFLTRCCAHPIIGNSSVFRHFLSATDQKSWKSGKRSAEHAASSTSLSSFIKSTSCQVDRPGDCEKLVAKFSKFSTWFDKQVHGLEKAFDSVMNNELSTSNDLSKVSQQLIKFGESGSSNASKGEKPDYHEWWTQDRHMDGLMDSLTQVGSRIQEVSNEMRAQLENDRDQVSDALREYMGILKTLPGIVKAHDSVLNDFNSASQKETVPAEQKEELREQVNIVGNMVLAEFRHIHENIVYDFKEILRGHAEAKAARHRKLAEIWESMISELN